MPGEVSVELDTRGSIDVAAERARLTKDRAAAEKGRAGPGEARQPRLRRQGPEPVVAKIRDRLAVAEADLIRIDAALEALPRDRPH